MRQYVEGQERGEGIYCLVDLHAITVKHDPAALRRQVHDTVSILIAAGLDPDRCILFRQSDVAEHTYLCWLLASVTAFGELRRMHQFKEKSAEQREFVSAGLFFYPVLQAADILAYQTDEVPVGEDQKQHIELARTVAERFNSRYGNMFTVPRHRIPDVGARILDLQDPDKKMSTTGGSEQGTVYILDSPEAIARKFKSAITDSGREIRRGARQARDLQPDRDHGRRARRVARRTSNGSTRADPGYARFKDDVGSLPSPSTCGRSGTAYDTIRSGRVPSRVDPARGSRQGPRDRGQDRRDRGRSDGPRGGLGSEMTPTAGPGSAERPDGGAFAVELPVFTGPFRVLADLILEQKIDVCDVSIATVTDGFLAHSKAAESWSLEEATWFLAVCAIMLELKVGRLMPRHEVVDEEDLLGVSPDLVYARSIELAAFQDGRARDREEAR